jgi:SAM-dependent methyltransferase
MTAVSPHPLARQLAKRLASRTGCRILEIGTGKGRNTAALLAAGFQVTSVDDDRERTEGARLHFKASGATFVTAAYAQIQGRPGEFAGALSTHALLHGSPEKIAHALAAIARVLEPDAPFYCTFGSTADARFGRGMPLEAFVFAEAEGEEAGVAHSYFDRARLQELLRPYFRIDELAERAVDDIVGSWAHARPAGMVQWLARLRAMAKP